ncbi:Protein of unknown function, partial [Gryllus bimaculatus]
MNANRMAHAATHCHMQLPRFQAALSAAWCEGRRNCRSLLLSSSQTEDDIAAAAASTAPASQNGGPLVNWSP